MARGPAWAHMWAQRGAARAAHMPTGGNRQDAARGAGSGPQWGGCAARGAGCCGVEAGPVYRVCMHTGRLTADGYFKKGTSRLLHSYSNLFQRHTTSFRPDFWFCFAFLLTSAPLSLSLA